MTFVKQLWFGFKKEGKGKNAMLFFTLLEL
jgi:hypothetical protein